MGMKRLRSRWSFIQVQARLQNSQSYWTARSRLLTIAHWVLSQRVRAQRSISSGSETVHVLFGFARLIAGQALLAVLSVAIFFLLNIPLRGHIYPADLAFNPNSYGGLLATLVQVAGVFIALYFTAISVVASTTYASVRGRVYAVLIRALGYNRYIKVVALFGAVATLLLLMTSLRVDPGTPTHDLLSIYLHPAGKTRG